MARKKSKQSPGKEDGSFSQEGLPSIPSSLLSQTSHATATNNASSTSSSASTAAKKPPSSALLISRNKHWRHISCYHGAWLQMPVEILEAIAHINYNTLQPRPIDPASLFDTLKVRRLVDEATSLAVRAASDIASPMLTNVNGSFTNLPAMTALTLGSSGHGAKLSRERKFRMREQACQKLGRAYRLDEISCSVATMQGASPLEEAGKLVMQRRPGDADARYVNFFHEKIPSRQIAECTSLQPLTDIISDRPEEPEVLRTRALVRVFKRDFDGAILDLAHALSACRFVRSSHDAKPVRDHSQGQDLQRTGSKRRPNDVILSEKEQPTSFEGQILFQRASVYLSLACEHVQDGMPAPSPSSGARRPDAEKVGNDSNEATVDSTLREGVLEKQAESRRLAKHFAKRAIKDYLSFMSRFHYSPDYPIKAVREYTGRVSSLNHSGRIIPRESCCQQAADGGESHAVYSLPELFAAVPPANLPPYPTPESREHQQGPSTSSPTTCEWMTFHPLMTDTLHSLLLCHLLVQTSVKELQRHAYMVARLVRLADGFPVFHSSRSSSRADWLEIIRRAGNWLHLTDTWENLTSPTLIPMVDPEPEQQRKRLSDSSSSSSSSSSSTSSSDSPSLSPSSYTSTIKASTSLSNLHAKSSETLGASLTNNNHTTISTSSSYENKLSKWLVEDTREYTLLTDRAASLARWLQEAPPVAGTTTSSKRKKRPNKKKTCQTS